MTRDRRLLLAARRRGTAIMVIASVGAAACTAPGDLADDGGAPRGNPDVVTAAGPVQRVADGAPPRAQFVVECPAPTVSNDTHHIYGTAGGQCDQVRDRSSYVVPAERGRAAGGLAAIYRVASAVDVATLHPMPAGLQMQAEVTRRCDTTRVDRCSGDMTLSAVFPDCWDGVTLADPEQRHVDASARGRCPATHPVHMPQLVLVAAYASSVDGGLGGPAGAAQSPSSEISAHAFFTNGWSPEKLDVEVRSCLRRQVTCGQPAPHLRNPA